MKTKLACQVVGICTALLLAVACGPKGDNDRGGGYSGGGSSSGGGGNHGGGFGSFPTGPSTPEDRKPNEVQFLHLDLSDANAIVTFEESSGALASESASTETDTKYAVSSGISNLTSVLAGLPYRITRSGQFRWGLRSFIEESNDTFDDDSEEGIDLNRLKGLPHVSYVAIGPKPYQEIFVVFEHAFLYIDTVKIQGKATSHDGYPDLYSNSSPFTCQIFKVKQQVGSYATADRVQKSNLECISNTFDSSGNFVNKVEINTWDSRGALMKFDDSGNLYFTAHVPGNWKNVMLKRDRVTGKLTEVINANICFKGDYVVTGPGGVLYTGQTSTNGQCEGAGFFRFVSPKSQLFEVARNWWNFVFEYIDAGTKKGQMYFYGPNPAATGAPSWNTACLYRFDPEATDDVDTTSVDERVTNVASCQSDMWGYVNSPTDQATKKTRCTEEKDFLNGGDAPKDILLADVDDDDDDEIYVITKSQHKKAGTWFCNLCVDEAHCYSGATPDPDLATEAACVAANKTWSSSNKCYNDLTTSVCSVSKTNWNNTYQDCRSPGNEWAAYYESLLRVNDDTSVTRLSATGEEVVAAWSIRRAGKVELYYSSFASGTYSLHKVEADGTKKAMLSNVEVTRLTRDPAANSSLVFINGLNFSDNTFVVGTFNPDANKPSETLTTETKLTGTIDTMVILGD